MLDVYVGPDLTLFSFLSLNSEESEELVYQLRLEKIEKERIKNVLNNVKIIVIKKFIDILFYKCGYEINYESIPQYLLEKFVVEESQISFWDSVDNEQIVLEKFSKYVENVMKSNDYPFNIEDEFYGLTFEMAYFLCGNKKYFNDCLIRNSVNTEVLILGDIDVVFDSLYYNINKEGIIANFYDKISRKNFQIKLWYNVFDEFEITSPSDMDMYLNEYYFPRNLNETIFYPYFYIYLELICIYILNKDPQKIIDYGNKLVIDYCSSSEFDPDKKIKVLKPAIIDNVHALKIIIDAVKNTYK